MASDAEQARPATRWGPFWSLRIALLLTLVLIGFASARTLLHGGATPRWSPLASCVTQDDAAVRRVAATVDTSGCTGPANVSQTPGPAGSVVVAFVLPSSAGSEPRVRDVEADPVGHRLFLAYDPAGADVPPSARVVVFVAVRSSELPRSPFEIADDTGAVRVWAPVDVAPAT
jgi:hypothetical protein